MKFINDLNLRRQADDLGVRVWQTPGGLFIIMGVITVFVMFATYFISRNYDNPNILIVSECIITVIILSVTTSITRFVGQLSKLNRMKSEFVSVASHQLRTPLSAIRWETELLLSKHVEGLDARQLKTIENISSLSHKMTRLVNDLLDVAQIDQKRLILKRKPFDLAKNVETSLEELKPIFYERHIEYAFKAEKNLPMAVADQEKMKLVVDNLIGNAVKYTTSGGKVEIGLFQRKENLVFEVKDNGVGIPEEQQDRVFQKFFRSDNAAKYQTEGTGLGLYIAKNVIEQLGGKIWFQSIENVGSIFSFSLPISACPGK